MKGKVIMTIERKTDFLNRCKGCNIKTIYIPYVDADTVTSSWFDKAEDACKAAVDYVTKNHITTWNNIRVQELTIAIDAKSGAFADKCLIDVIEANEKGVANNEHAADIKIKWNSLDDLRDLFVERFAPKEWSNQNRK